jgi:hypothetical protein
MLPHHTTEERMRIEKSVDVQIDVAKEFERVTEIVGKVREAIVTMKDADVSIKNWHFAIDKMDKEYTVDFALKLTVTPHGMGSSEMTGSQ